MAVHTPDVLHGKGRGLAQITKLPQFPPIDLQLYLNTATAIATPANDMLHDYWIRQFRQPLTA